MRVFSLNLNDTVLVWLSLLYEALPFVALGSLLSGVVETYLSRETVARWIPRNRWLGVVASAFLGLAFPMCECGVVPVVRRLIRKGVPVPCALSYMLAAPVLHPLVLVSTWVAFRGQGAAGMTLLRAGLGLVVAVSTALVLWRVFGETGVARPGVAAADDGCDEDGHDGGHEHSHGAGGGWSDVVRALRTAADDLVSFGAFLVVGTGIAAVINSGFSRAAVAPVADHPLGSVAGFMLMAVLLNLCSEADAFVAASFSTFPFPAQLSFLVLGPMLDIKSLVMYLAVFRRRPVGLMVALLVALVFGVCATGAGWIPAVIGWLGP